VGKCKGLTRLFLDVFFQPFITRHGTIADRRSARLRQFINPEGFPTVGASETAIAVAMGFGMGTMGARCHGVIWECPRFSVVGLAGILSILLDLF